MSLHPDIAAVLAGESEGCIIHGDCLQIMADMPGGCVDAIVADPPYNIRKAEWDNVESYLPWCGEWIDAASVVLRPSGAFWISHSQPLILAHLSGLVATHGRGLRNWITWDKYGEGVEHAQKGFLDGFTVLGGARSWQPMAEYLAYHADDGEWDTACGKLWSGEFERRRGFIFESLRAYLDDERARAGITVKQVHEATQTQMAGHWFGRSQWALPTREHYETLRRLFNAKDGDYLRQEYDDLRQEYDDLRQEYEHLRYTFNNPGEMSSVWQIAPAKPNWHPTPKPAELLRRIIEATTNAGDCVLDPFSGSGTTCVAAKTHGRRWIGIELNERYAEKSRDRTRCTPRQLFTETMTNTEAAKSKPEAASLFAEDKP